MTIKFRIISKQASLLLLNVWLCGGKYVSFSVSHLKESHFAVDEKTACLQSHSNFSWKIISKGEIKGAVRLTLCELSTSLWDKVRRQHRELRALLYSISEWVVLTSPANHVSLKMQKTAPTVYSPCPITNSLGLNSKSSLVFYQLS